MTWFLFLVALAAGTSNPLQSGANAELNKHFSQPLWTGLFVYATGLAGILLVQLFIRQPAPVMALNSVPWWAWLGGLISLAPTIIGLTVAQKMGSGLFTGASISAALITSILLDHFGLVGFTRHPVSPARLAGCVLMVGGLWLIARF
jgi:transporter family-2 protein